MKRLVRYKMNFGSKFLTLSGVMMGVAFFFQALEYFALRDFQEVPQRTLLMWLIIPMSLDALWCVPLRSEMWKRAEVHGIFAAMICVVLLVQAILSVGIIPMVIGCSFYVIAAAATVLITWGFIAHRALGILVFAATGAMWVLIIALPVSFADSSYMTLISLVPSGCLILSLLLFFGGIRICEE